MNQIPAKCDTKKANLSGLAFFVTALAVGRVEVLLREAALFDAGRLTGALTQVVDACTTDLASLVHLNFFHGGRGDGEDALHTHAAGHLANGEGFGGTRTAALNHNTLEGLKTFLAALFNLDGHGDGVAGAKLRPVLCFDQFGGKGKYHPGQI